MKALAQPTARTCTDCQQQFSTILPRQETCLDCTEKRILARFGLK